MNDEKSGNQNFNLSQTLFEVLNSKKKKKWYSFWVKFEELKSELEQIFGAILPHSKIEGVTEIGICKFQNFWSNFMNFKTTNIKGK